MDFPKKVEDQINRYEEMRGQLQMLMDQKYHMSNRVKEIERAIDELEKVEEDTTVYRSVGSLLIRVASPKGLTEDLKEEMETTGIRLGSIEKQERQMSGSVKELESEIQNAIKGMNDGA